MMFLTPAYKRKRVFSRLTAALLAVYFTTLAAAAEFPSAVSVRAILPENQVGNVSYYDLHLSPGTGQTIQMQLNNAEDRPVIATVELNPATTGMDGIIVYNHTDTLDESLLYPITKIARVRTPVVEIPAKSFTLVDIDITMPEEEITGVILGGLRVTSDYPENLSGATEPAPGQGLQIKNKFAYVIGLKLSQGGAETGPDFHLKDIRPRLINYAAAVVVNIQNSEPAIAKDIQFSAQIFQKGSQTVMKELVMDDAEMAPNSNCDFVIGWDNARIQPGSYRALVRMQYNERVWEWDEEFDVASGEAGSINNDALGLIDGTGASSAMKYIMACMMLILIVLLAYVLDKRGLKERKA